MALATSLEIYKQSSALLSLAVDVQANIPRAFRASMGTRIADECVDLLVLIGRANAARIADDRAMHIARLLEHLEVAVLLLRVAHDKKLISTKLWSTSITLTDSVGKQANGWLKHARTTRSTPRNACSMTVKAAMPVRL